MITNTKHLTGSALYALASCVTILALLSATFLILEPSIGHSQETFRIRQTITDETSFLVPPTNVDMDDTITGVTGGTTNGSTTFSVISNNAGGYTVTIAYQYDGAHAMFGDTSGSESIRDFDDVAGVPRYNFVASTAAQFGYTVRSLDDTDTPQAFLDNGALCNQGAGSQNAYQCWKAPEVGAYTIVDRGSSAVTGATTTLDFRIDVPNGSVPSVTADTYTATATLTLLIQ